MSYSEDRQFVNNKHMDIEVLFNNNRECCIYRAAYSVHLLKHLSKQIDFDKFIDIIQAYNEYKDNQIQEGRKNIQMFSEWFADYLIENNLVSDDFPSYEVFEDEIEWNSELKESVAKSLGKESKLYNRLVE